MTPVIRRRRGPFFPVRAASQLAGGRPAASLAFIAGSRVSMSSRYSRMSIPTQRQKGENFHPLLADAAMWCMLFAE